MRRAAPHGIGARTERLVAQMPNRTVEVDEDGPKDGGAEKDGEETAARSGVEAPDGVAAVEFAEAVFEGGALAPLAGAAQMQTLRRGDRRLDCGMWLHRSAQ